MAMLHATFHPKTKSTAGYIDSVTGQTYHSSNTYQENWQIQGEHQLGPSRWSETSLCNQETAL